MEKPCSERGSCLVNLIIWRGKGLAKVGVLQGEGKRSGSGRCSCDQGYQGDICDTCVEGYFKNELEDGNCTSMNPY